MGWTCKLDCVECKYFGGYDGVDELYILCDFGDFKGSKTSCEHFEKRVTKSDLLHQISELEKENKELKQRFEASWLNKICQENEQLLKKVMILSAHLLSDECCLTDGQIRKIRKELEEC